MTNADAEPRLSSQLRHAVEMGYSDNEIYAALDLKTANKVASGARRSARHHGLQPYSPFESLNAMIDALIVVQSRGERKHSNLDFVAMSATRSRILPRQVAARKTRDRKMAARDRL